MGATVNNQFFGSFRFIHNFLLHEYQRHARRSIDRGTGLDTCRISSSVTGGPRDLLKGHPDNPDKSPGSGEAFRNRLAVHLQSSMVRPRIAPSLGYKPQAVMGCDEAGLLSAGR